MLKSDKRMELIDQFRSASRSDVHVRDAICVQLDKLFKRRVDWCRRHSASYRWAKNRNLINKAHGPGIRNGVKTLKITAAVQASIAAGQDKIHAHCKLHGLDYLTQRRMGFDLRRLIEAGTPPGEAVASVIGGVV